MITSLTIRNFKSIKEQIYNFTNFDLLVGRNNSGKSSILQALAIWQYCIYEFHRGERSGSRGKQFVLPNFTALPLPEFNLLWTDRIDRQYPKIEGKISQEYIYIEIIVKWDDSNGIENEFGVKIRYQSPQSVFAIPNEGWKKFHEMDNSGILPRLVYVPPFSGLEPVEKWLDDGNIREQVGKAQPGSVLRNLLYRVIDKPFDNKDINSPDWQEIVKVIDRLFSINIEKPSYEKGISTRITCNYKDRSGKKFDIISGGSGFHQTLTLLAFLYGYEDVTTILFDEPDAHLHTSLQRELLDYFIKQSEERNVQFIIATHSEEFIKGVNTSNIMSILKQKAERVGNLPEIITALSEVDNIEITQTIQSPYIIYVEGESDERIIRTWAGIINKTEILSKYCFKTMGGGPKEQMKIRADNHYKGLSQIVAGVKRLMIFDLDAEESAFHPGDSNPSLFEWKRKNIENYLLIPDAWRRAAMKMLNCSENDLFIKPVFDIIENFFENQNLTLPRNKKWNNVDANIFKVVDGKRILYQDKDSLFQMLKRKDKSLIINMEILTANMLQEELHEDILNLFNKMEQL